MKILILPTDLRNQCFAGRPELPPPAAQSLDTVPRLSFETLLLSLDTLLLTLDTVLLLSSERTASAGTIKSESCFSHAVLMKNEKQVSLEIESPDRPASAKTTLPDDPY